MKSRVLVYAHDPMCSWCWAFRPTWAKILEKLPDDVAVKRLLGGLAPDSDDSMAVEMQQYLQQTWQTIQRQVPGTQFNFDFWTKCKPRRSTYPSCRGVIAARNQRSTMAESMTIAIQEAYYLQARNPSDYSTLVEIAGSLELNLDRFSYDLTSPETESALADELSQCRSLGLNSFPSLVLLNGDHIQHLRYDYNNPQIVLDQILTTPRS